MTNRNQIECQTLRECERCKGITKAGGRCSRNTCLYADYCWQHTRSTRGLKIARSHIPRAGRGLFATKNHPAGTVIQYARDVDYVPFDELERRYPGDTLAVYALCGTSRCYDARSTQSGLGRWINDPLHDPDQVNAVFMENNVDQKPYIQLIRDVIKGEEIYASYGTEYWGGPSRTKTKSKSKSKRAARRR